MKDSTRTTLLLSLLAVVALVVVVDAFRDKGAPADEAPATDLTDRVQGLEDRVTLVEHEQEWTQALQERERQWTDIRAASIEAATPELAVADFRSMLVDAASTFDLKVDRTDRSTSRPLEGLPPSSARVHELEVRLTLSSHDLRALHRFVDSVEHLRDVKTHISELTLQGPGLAQARESASVTLTIRALGITPAPDTASDTGGNA